MNGEGYSHFPSRIKIMTSSARHTTPRTMHKVNNTPLRLLVGLVWFTGKDMRRHHRRGEERRGEERRGEERRERESDNRRKRTDEEQEEGIELKV